MRATFTAEIMKLRRRPAIWVLLGIWALMVTAFAYVIPYIIYVTPSANTNGTSRPDILNAMLPHAFVQNILVGFPLFGAAIMVIAGAMLAGSEFAWGTLGAMFTQRPGRLSVLAGKVTALIALAVVFTGIAFAIGAIASPIVAAAQHQAQNWPSAAQIFEGLGAGWLVAIAAAVGGLFIAVLFRSASVPVGLGLVYLLVVESIVAGFANSSRTIADIQKALPAANGGALVKSLISLKGIEAPGVSASVGWLQATIVLAIWVAGFLAVSALLLRRRDVTGAV